jgi:hypothetical protein
LKKTNKKQSSKPSKYAPKIEQIRRRLHLRKRDGYLSDGDQEILSESDFEFESNRRKKNRVTFADDGDNHDISPGSMFFTKFSCGEVSDNYDEALDHFKEHPDCKVIDENSGSEDRSNIENLPFVTSCSCGETFTRYKDGLLHSESKESCNLIKVYNGNASLFADHIGNKRPSC